MIYRTEASDKMRPVNAGNAGEAAQIFADRLARREFGKAGYCRTLRRDSWASNGAYSTFEVFIGRDLYGITRNQCDRGTTTGRNVWITVYRDEN